MSTHLEQAELWLAKHSDLMLQYSVNIVAAIVILIIGYLVAKIISNSMLKLLENKQMDKAVAEFISGLVRYLVFIIALIAALSRIGVQTASVVAVLAAAGLAVGLALQGVLSNFAAGVLIVAFRPFKSGDFVVAGGVSGSVEAIHIFQTILKTADNKMVVIPNSSVIGGAITNYSKHTTRRVDLTVGVSYSADLQLTKKVIRETLEKDLRILKDPDITIGVLALADSSVNLVVRPWCNTSDYWPVYYDSTQAIKEALDANGIDIPFPQMDLHMSK
ncbi:mechanosensitive ion channel [Vibrio profundum]|uniref:mechanosensitive ion channel domain-containing protein n=1 Tax=Vibrio profundum TaxID=2910247 RepID=UPI003D14E8CB